MNRLLRFGGAVIGSNLRRLSRPYRINFCVTYRCQSRCKMCNIWELRPEGELSLDEIRQFAAKNPIFSWVQLTGGEPYLRTDIVEIGRAFEESSHPFILTSQTNSLCSNGSIEAKVRGLAEIPIPHFIFTLSLDGPEEIHDFQRGVDGNFKKVQELYEKLHPLEKERDGFKVVFAYTMTKFNAGKFAETVKVMRLRFPWLTEDDFHLNYSQVSPNYYHNETEGFDDDRIRAANEIEASMSRRRFPGALGFMERRFMAGLVFYLRNGRPPLGSKELEASIFMDSFGAIYPSVMWGLKVGDIRKSDYRLEYSIPEKEGPLHWTSCEAYQSILGSLV